MSRIDHKHGRQNADQATDNIFKAMRGYAENNGDWIMYYRLNRATTQYHSVYDEAINGGLQYFPAVRIQCVHVIHIDGPKQDSSGKGFYYNDALNATIAFDLFIQAGMSLADIETGNYVNDRVLYDRKLFEITQLSTEGQIQQRDIIVGLEATQLKPDELVNDTMFAQWSLGGPDDVQGTQ